MKILLIDPPSYILTNPGVVRPVFPLGLSSIAAVLTNMGHKVRFLLPDLNPLKLSDPWKAIGDAVSEESPDLVGITGMSPQWTEMKQTVEVVFKKLGPEIPIIVGGQHATCWTEDVAKWPHVYAVVYGEGEIAISELINNLRKPGFKPWSVPGVVCFSDGIIKYGPPHQVVKDLDSLPDPVREGLVWGDHRNPALYTAIIGSRGCPFTCGYCSLTLASGGSIRYRSVSRILDELFILINQYKATNIIFHDTVFPLQKARTLELLSQMIQRNLVVPFVAQTRCDVLNFEVAEAMANAGCSLLFLGIESGSEETLAKLNKPMAISKIEQAVNIAHKANLRLAGFFMVGFPWETELEIRKTVKFALSLGLTRISLHSVNPIPGSKLWDLVPTNKRIIAKDFVNPELNLTSLPDNTYKALFYELKEQCEIYNRKAILA